MYESRALRRRELALRASPEWEWTEGNEGSQGVQSYDHRLRFLCRFL